MKRNKEIIFENNDICIYCENRLFYYQINNDDPVLFSPYKINGTKHQKDIEDIKEIIDDKSLDKVLFDIQEKHKEHVKEVWEQIEYMKNFTIDEPEEQKKDKKKQRPIKIPIQFCKDINELTPKNDIEYINFYNTVINSNEYLIDIIKTSNMKFYVRITNITDDEYKEINFNEFKKKYAQPSLFDYFNI